MDNDIIVVAKINAEQVAGMDEHCVWAMAGRTHLDGWTCYAAPEKRDQILGQLARDGCFELFVEEGGLVRWQLTVSHALFFPEDAPVEYSDPVHPAPVYGIRTLVVYAGARQEIIEPSRLRRPDGDLFRPQARGGRYFAYALAEPWMAEW